MVRTKVFVGNLSFQTKEAELAQEFGTAGKVISANIITRGPRSLGYGFVEMESEADADNAVKLLNKKEIGGRPINVEVAKPREEGAKTLIDKEALKEEDSEEEDVVVVDLEDLVEVTEVEEVSEAEEEVEVVEVEEEEAAKEVLLLLKKTELLPRQLCLLPTCHSLLMTMALPKSSRTTS